jgi:hypothetical protein
VGRGNVRLSRFFSTETVENSDTIPYLPSTIQYGRGLSFFIGLFCCVEDILSFLNCSTETYGCQMNVSDSEVVISIDFLSSPLTLHIGSPFDPSERGFSFFSI